MLALRILRSYGFRVPAGETLGAPICSGSALDLGQVGGQVVGEPSVSSREGLGLRALRFPHGSEPVVIGVDHRGGINLLGWEGLTS